MGKVLKVTWITKEDGSYKRYLIESLQVAKGDTNSDLTVNFLAFEKKFDPVRKSCMLILIRKFHSERCG